VPNGTCAASWCLAHEHGAKRPERTTGALEATPVMALAPEPAPPAPEAPDATASPVRTPVDAEVPFTPLSLPAITHTS
jgi:hypothetical protein